MLSCRIIFYAICYNIIVVYVSQNDISRKPQREITIDDLCRITRADGAATFEISTSKKTFYLTADSIAAMEDWVKVLQVISIHLKYQLSLALIPIWYDYIECSKTQCYQVVTEQWKQ